MVSLTLVVTLAAKSAATCHTLEQEMAPLPWHLVHIIHLGASTSTTQRCQWIYCGPRNRSTRLKWWGSTRMQCSRNGVTIISLMGMRLPTVRALSTCTVPVSIASDCSGSHGDLDPTATRASEDSALSYNLNYYLQLIQGLNGVCTSIS